MGGWGKPSCWTVSPQMTEDPNLWFGCVHFYAMLEGVGPPQDLVTGNRAADTLLDWEVTDGGLAITLGSTSGAFHSGVADPASTIIGQAPHQFTLVWDGHFNDIGGSDGSFWQYVDSDDSRGIEIHTNYWTGGNLSFVLRQDWGGGSTGFGVVDNADAVHIFRVDTSGAHGNTQELWVGGELKSSATGVTEESLQTNFVNAKHLLKGNGPNSCRFAGTWAGWQSDDFVQRMSADPYAMLRPVGF